MNRDRAVQQLRAVANELHGLGVEELSLFGSVARNEGGPASDLDLMLVLSPGPFWGRYNKVLDLLESRLRTRIDLVPKADLKPQLRAQIEAEAIRVA